MRSPRQRTSARSPRADTVEALVRDDELEPWRRPGRSVGVPPRKRVVVGRPAGDDRAKLEDRALEELAVALFTAERPLVQPLAAVAHRLLRATVRRGHEPVQGHADVEDHRAHAHLPVDPCFHRRTASTLVIVVSSCYGLWPLKAYSPRQPSNFAIAGAFPPLGCVVGSRLALSRESTSGG